LKLWLLALTDFGDAAVLIPLASAILTWLLMAGGPRLAGWWVVSVGFCIGLTSILKIFFYGCPPASDIRSPSGHTAFSVLVYGALVLITTVQGTSWRRLLAVGIGFSLILSIAASRLLLDAHSLIEIGLGFMIGTVCLVLFSRRISTCGETNVWPLLAAASVLVTILHGQELHAEEFLHRITGYLQVHCR
jgi:membrane-associated phospholipid phosphatase